ncbi:MAG: hypothetical protein K2Y32_01720 [Candidatus Obscuribacterales bacterium]|nr:hypothetical protein [Candidatus Obscuribacterales bacterium]
MGQPPELPQSQGQNNDQPDESGVRRFLQTQINKSQQPSPDQLAAKIWSMSPANTEATNPANETELKREGWGQGHRARNNQPESEVQPVMPTTPIMPQQTLAKAQENASAGPSPQAQAPNETKPQKRSLNSVLKGLQPGKSSGNEELAKPNLIEPLAKAESNFRDITEANLAQKNRTQEIKPPIPAPTETSAPLAQIRNTGSEPISLNRPSPQPPEVNSQIVNSQMNTGTGALRFLQNQEQRALPLQMPENLSVQFIPNENKPEIIKPEISKPVHEIVSPSPVFQIDNEAFEAPNCIQTMRIDTMSGVKTITTMLPDSSSTRIESKRADGSCTITFTENLKSNQSIQARPIVVKELDLHGVLVSETRYQYHNLNTPCIPTGKRMIIGDQVIDYTLNASGQIIDQKLVPPDKL